MKLKTKLSVAFLTMMILPFLLSSLLITIVGHHQLKVISETYDVRGGTSLEVLTNPIEVLGQGTEYPFDSLCVTARNDSEKLEDEEFLESFNSELESKNSYLLIRKGEELAFSGNEKEDPEKIVDQLPEYNGDNTTSKNGIYLGGKVQALVKQADFRYEDGTEGSAFIVTDVSNVLPEIRELAQEIVVIVMAVLMMTMILLMFWIYQAVMGPVDKMKKATRNITEGNLDFEIETETDDEFGQLFHDFDDMRKRLKMNAEEKLQFDKENKELISNISHDLKTPVTTIKGYAEGILDGVADTPEKVDKYVRTIYNKANEMNMLINELTLYSKIDTNRIPYNFNTISVNAYFDDCAEELSMELESKNVEFGYFNYVEGDVKIIADAEQIKRVIHNIVNNSVKYMDKPKGLINLRIKDVGDFIQVELEDNGKGIAMKDLPNIFERFYRTDASRNSSKGGSGIGLAIVKKIVEEHGGKIWANSREGTGTTMSFVLRKYQEVPNHE